MISTAAETTPEEWNDVKAVVMCSMSYLNELLVLKMENTWDNKSKGHEELLKSMRLLHRSLRMRDTSYFFVGRPSQSTHVRGVSVPVQTRPIPCMAKFRFPGRSIVSRQFIIFGYLPLRIFLFRPWDAYANGGQYHTLFLGMTAKFSGPKCRKSDHGGKLIKAPPEVHKRLWAHSTGFGGPQSQDGVENQG